PCGVCPHSCSGRGADLGPDRGGVEAVVQLVASRGALVPDRHLAAGHGRGGVPPGGVVHGFGGRPGGGQRTFRSSGHCLGIGYRTSVGPHAVRRTRRRGGDPDHGRGRVAVGSARNARGEPAPWAHRHGDVGVSHHTPV